MFLSKRKAFLVPGCVMWTLEYLATQKVKHIVLPPNMDSSSLLVTIYDKQGLSQMRATKTDMTFLARTMHFCTNITMLLLSVNYPLAVDIGLPWTNTIPPSSLLWYQQAFQSNTICSSPLLWYSQVSPTNTIPCLFRSAQRSLQTYTIPLLCCGIHRPPMPLCCGNYTPQRLLCIMHISAAL